MVSLRSRRRKRGQGTTELVLGLLIFVTVLIFGIHFAEVGYLSLKVQEASTSALWDSTSADMHRLPGNFTRLTNLIGSNTPGQLATERYKDFDGRTSKVGAKAPVQVFTSADGLEVTCGTAQDVAFRPSSSTNGVYQNVGGMRCSSKAVLAPVKAFTRSFLDKGQGAMFDVPHYAVGAIPVCGTGRARDGDCAGGYGILLDDWGLSSAEESRECILLDGEGCANTAYYQSAKRVYDKHNTVNGASQKLAKAIVGSAPINPGQFWMSFRGMGGFSDKVNGGAEGPEEWVTTPGANSPSQEYDTAYSGRGDCFLGATCN